MKSFIHQYNLKVMKKIFFFTAITFVTLSSCQKEAATLPQDQPVAESQLQTNASSSQLETNASSSGGAVPFSDVFTFSLVGNGRYNPCTNELITVISGNLLLNVHGVYNGNNSTITVHANVYGIMQVGESGREYHSSGSFNRQESNFSNGVFTTKLEHFDRWITAGSDNNLIVKDTYYVKVDAEGNVTVIRDPVSETYCQ